MSMISEQIEELRLMAEMFVNGEPYGNLLRRAANTIEMLSEKARESKRGEWIDKAISIIDDMQREGIIDYEQAWEFRMRARMKGADDE